MDLKGTQTEKNLLAAFAGESQARNRYTYYASEARKAGYEFIAAIFLETADNEKEHAKVYFNHLTQGGSGQVEIAAGYPFHLGNTASNFEAAAQGEHYEWTTMYPDFAKVARDEGFEAVAMVFEAISVAEKQHGKRYKELAARVRDLELAVTWEAFRSDAARLAGAEGEHEDLRASTAALDAKVARAEANLEAERSRHLNREQELQRASEQLYTLRTEIQSLESRVEYERREREGLLRLAGEREVEEEQLEAQLSANAAALGETLEESSCLDERIQTERAQLAEREGVLREQTESLAARQGRREAMQSRLVDLSTERATLESRSEALEDRWWELELRLRQNEEPLEARTLEIEGFRREELALEARVRKALAEKDDLGRHLADVLRAHAQRSAQLEQLRGEVSSARERWQQASARLEALREAAKLESTRVDEVLKRLPAERRRYVHGILSDVLCAEAGLEAALEAVLAGRLDAVLVEDPKSALDLLDWFRKEDVGAPRCSRCLPRRRRSTASCRWDGRYSIS